MGLFDFFFKKKQETPKQAILPRLEVNAEELEKELEIKREKPLSELLPECKEIPPQAEEQVEKVKNSLENFKKTPLDEKMAHYNIARQMKPEFERRALPALNAIRFPKNDSFEQYFDFHKSLQEAIKQFTKASFDNRYLLALFPKKFEPIGSGIKHLAGLSEQLGKKLQSKQKKLDEFSTAKQALEKIEQERKHLNNLEQKKQETSSNLHELEKKVSALEKNAKELSNLESSRNRITELDQKQSNAKRAALDLLSPLHRAFKKLEKTAMEKNLSKTAKKYYEQPLASLLQENPGNPE
ncbi:MAG: hypothetical protein ACE5DI_05645, partial [Candidatus Micrarchaeia archaeon]